MSSQSTTVQATQECAMPADTGWRAQHASRTALLGLDYIDGSASQAGLHRRQARDLLLPFRNPTTTLTEAVL